MQLAVFLKNYKIYFLVFLIYFIPRILDIGNDIQNLDAHWWYDRSLNFADALFTGNFADTYQQYHPGVTLMWVTGIPLKIFTTVFESKFGFSPFLYAKFFWYRQFVVLFPLAIIYSLMGVMIFNYLKKIINLKYALIFSILLSLEPFFLGITRFYHVTGLIAVFSYASTLAAIDYVLTNNKYSLFVFSIFSALALLTKSNALVFWGLNIAVIGINFLYYKEYTKIITQLLKSIIITIVVFITLWPAMWVAPFSTVNKVLNDGVVDTAFNEFSEPDLTTISHNQYLYYSEINLYRLSGMLTLLLFTGIIVYIIRSKEINNKLVSNKNILLLLTLSILYYGVYYFALSIPTKLKDRYIVVYIPYLVTIATFIYYYIFSKLSANGKKFLIALTIIYYLFVSWVNYPVYSFYYSELLGGASGINDFGYTLVSRGEYLLPVASYLHKQAYLQNKNPEQQIIIAFGGHTQRSLWPAYMGKAPGGTDELLAGEKATYWLAQYDTVDMVPIDKCDFERNFGPRWPFDFAMFKLYKCKDLTNKP